MRTCTLLLSIILWASAATWGFDFAMPVMPDWADLLGPTPTLPATITMETPVNVSFTPPMPGPQDEVVMTITGWKQVSNHVVDRVEIRTEGQDIFVDVYWIVSSPPRYPMNVIQSTMEQVPRAQMTATFERYEITRSLGTFEPGTYTVHITNRGVIGGGAWAIFTVRDLGPSVELGNLSWPFWLLPMM